MTAIATKLVLAALLAAQTRGVAASASETCRFAGTTDHDGHVVVTSEVAVMDGVTQVDVAVAFDAATMPWLPIRYLVEEISTWRSGTLESVAVNTRYLAGNHIVRQQWDTFQRAGDGLQARRVQAKTLADLRETHPGFVHYWDPATFGQPWLHDYQSASPERRADLDLKGAALPPGLRSPLALAFYWIRWLPRDGADVPVFLPGFKHDPLARVTVAAAPSTSGLQWRVLLHHAALNEAPASTATAWTSSDGHLLQLAFEAHGPHGSAQGQIHQEGCQGTPVAPAGQPP